MLNAVVEAEGEPAAILIRAIEPLEGLDIIAERRVGRSRHEWTSGPGRLTAALNITRVLNQVDLTTSASTLWIEDDLPIAESEVRTGPRIGLGKTPEPWYSMPWRYWVSRNAYVSR